MEGTIVMLRQTLKGKGECDPLLFESVGAAAVWFAHEVRRNLIKEDKAQHGTAMPAGAFGHITQSQILEEVARQVALLFAQYDGTTGKDPEEVTACSKDSAWAMDLKTVLSEEMSRSDAQCADDGVVPEEDK